MSIDIRIYEKLGQIAAFGSDMTKLGSQTDTWADDVHDYRRTVVESWEGKASDKFTEKAKQYAQQLSDLSTTAKGFGQTVETFHDSIKKCQEKFTQMRSDADKVPLPTTDASIEPPPPIICSPDDTAAIDEYNRKLSAYHALEGRAREVRQAITNAHIEFDDACSKVKAPDGITVKVTAVEERNYLGAAVDLEGETLDAAVRAISGDLGAASLVQWFDKESKVLGGVGWVIDGIDVGEAAWQQWQRDSYDPTLTDGERLERAVGVGLADKGLGIASGAIASWEGAETGAEIGLIGGPETAAAGGLIGGVLGGMGGSAAGEHIEDQNKVPAEEWINGHIGRHHSK
jgi:uncharacterized protein YukE